MWNHPKLEGRPGGWIADWQYVHTIEYYSAREGSKLQTHKVTWVDPKDIVLSKGSQKSLGTGKTNL